MPLPATLSTTAVRLPVWVKVALDTLTPFIHVLSVPPGPERISRSASCALPPVICMPMPPAVIVVWPLRLSAPPLMAMPVAGAPARYGASAAASPLWSESMGSVAIRPAG